jgi:AraC family transcriptional activator of pobA
VTTIPNYALYGTDAQPAWYDSVHFEWIRERSGAHDYDIAPHFHEALLQVLYVCRGGGEALIDDARWPLAAPCLIILPARSVHGFRFSRDIDGPVVTAAQRPLESIATAAAPDLLPHIRRPMVLAVDQSSRPGEALMPLFDSIERESRTHAPGQLAAGMSLLVALFVQIARIGATTAAPQVMRSRKSAQIERFRAMVDAHFREHRTVDQYAQALGVTAGQLTRLCRDQLGMSTIDAINARLVHEARRELAYSTQSVKQIAGSLGFVDEAYFGRFFRKQTGHRPTEFRSMANRRLADAPA